MGVFGLMSHCLQRRDECMKYVDLIEVAREKGGIQLLVDFYSFEHLLLRSFHKSLSLCSGNPYLRFVGGEYAAFDAYVTKLVKDLLSLNIELVMFIDGSKGSSAEGTQQKLQTWTKRHYRDLQKLYDILDLFNGKKDVKEISDETSVRPVCLEIQMLHTLKACECEVIQLACGEADYVLAKNLKMRPKAYAVVSNDSDFCIFDKCCFIPNDVFDLNKELKLGSETQWLPEKPKKLVCGVLFMNKIMQMLNLESHDQLIDVAVVMGTDFTSPFMQSLKHRIGFKQKGTITEAAAWVLQHGQAENHPVFRQEMQQNRDFCSAVEHTRQFYKLLLEFESQQIKGSITHDLVAGIQRGHYAPNLMAMHANFYWHRMLLEDCQYGSPSMECALAPLRAYIYRIVLAKQETHVTEYGRRPLEEFSTCVVRATNDRRIPCLNDINKDKIFQNLRTFNHIMTHQEGYLGVNFFDKYGRRNGFNLLVLRYFLVLNTQQNLHISLDEFLTFVAMVFCRVEEPWYCGLAIFPTLRCITLANCYQDIYRHAFSFLGTLLHVNHEFPPPKDVFSGAVFSAFYMMNTNHELLVNKMGFPTGWLGRIRHDFQHIIGEKRHIIKSLVSGIYDYNTRF